MAFLGCTKGVKGAEGLIAVRIRQNRRQENAKRNMYIYLVHAWASQKWRIHLFEKAFKAFH